MHKNARVTALGRVLAVRRVVSGESLRVVARGIGMSGRRLREWVRRWEAGDRRIGRVGRGGCRSAYRASSGGRSAGCADNGGAR